ncbi:hypothetical protein C8Q77DRAFT_804148 [Trametes polyzona]|nr:hypothetical protein C8Q77DRAFT_804148 [Trametes polyzona]
MIRRLWGAPGEIRKAIKLGIAEADIGQEHLPSQRFRGTTDGSMEMRSHVAAKTRSPDPQTVHNRPGGGSRAVDTAECAPLKHPYCRTWAVLRPSNCPQQRLLTGLAFRLDICQHRTG